MRWSMPGTVSPTTAFVGFLAGVCAIATGLTFLETIANPYTTVLGDPAIRRHAHQSRAILQRRRLDLRADHRQHVLLFQRRRGNSTGSQTLYIPYVVIAGVVVVLAVIFYFAYIPDIKTEDDYHLDDSTPGISHSIWTHPHFVMAVAAQFLYVAAQAGIFSFFINYMTAEVPAIPASWDAWMSSLAASFPARCRHGKLAYAEEDVAARRVIVEAGARFEDRLGRCSQVRGSAEELRHSLGDRVHHLHGFDAAGRGHVRPAAKVHEVAVAIETHLIAGDSEFGHEVALHEVAVALELRQRLLSGREFVNEGLVARNDLARYGLRSAPGLPA